METSTGELIAKLTNLSHNLALELRFKDSSLVLEVVGLLHSLPRIVGKSIEYHPESSTGTTSTTRIIWDVPS
jgi:hypothetical protein